jgi:hypothetical protein
MAYDEGLATRVRDVLGDRPGLAEKRMFGGHAEDEDLRRRVDRGVAYASSLPAR